MIYRMLYKIQPETDNASPNLFSSFLHSPLLFSILSPFLIGFLSFTRFALLVSRRNGVGPAQGAARPPLELHVCQGKSTLSPLYRLLLFYFERDSLSESSFCADSGEYQNSTIRSILDLHPVPHKIVV